jgi:hypothetical protein
MSLPEVIQGPCAPESDGGWRQQVLVDGLRFDLALTRAGTYRQPRLEYGKAAQKGLRYRAADRWQGVVRDAGGSVVWTGMVSRSCGPARLLWRAGIVPAGFAVPGAAAP